MKTEEFDPGELQDLYRPPFDASGGDNGQVTIIGGSKLFHGAPMLALKAASRLVDTVFFASPEESLRGVAERIRSELMSFIWVDWSGVDAYVAKSDAILIGPGFMRYRSETAPHGDRQHMCDEACRVTKDVTERLISKFGEKKWVIDAGSLQALKQEVIPRGSILTPNAKEFGMLFGEEGTRESVFRKAAEFNCVIVLKGVETVVASPKELVVIKGGNPGMAKGGTGDAQAGLTVGLCAKNEAFLAAKAASYLIKKAADSLYLRVGMSYNADDLADEVGVMSAP